MCAGIPILSRRAASVRCSRGSTTMELAIVLPLLLLLTIGSFETGRAVWAKHTLSHAVREGARYASVRSTASDDPATAAMIEARTKAAAVGLAANQVEVTTSWEPSNSAGSTVHVQARYAFHPVTPLLPFDTIELSTGTQRVIDY
jgi:Flp pilus assembly protein TadG